MAEETLQEKKTRFYPKNRASSKLSDGEIVALCDNQSRIIQLFIVKSASALIRAINHQMTKPDEKRRRIYRNAIRAIGTTGFSCFTIESGYKPELEKKLLEITRKHQPMLTGNEPVYV